MHNFTAAHRIFPVQHQKANLREWKFLFFHSLECVVDSSEKKWQNGAAEPGWNGKLFCSFLCLNFEKLYCHCWREKWKIFPHCCALFAIPSAETRWCYEKYSKHNGAEIWTLKNYIFFSFFPHLLGLYSCLQLSILDFLFSLDMKECGRAIEGGKTNPLSPPRRHGREWKTSSRVHVFFVVEEL